MSSDESDSEQSSVDDSDASSSVGGGDQSNEVDEAVLPEKTDRHVIPGTNIRAVCCHMDDVAIRLGTLFNIRSNLKVKSDRDETVETNEEKLSTTVPKLANTTENLKSRRDSKLSPQKKRQRLSMTPRDTDRSPRFSTAVPIDQSRSAKRDSPGTSRSAQSRHAPVSESSSLPKRKRKFNAAANQIKLLHYIRKRDKRKRKTVEDNVAKPEETKKKHNKFEMLVKKNAGAIKYVNKMEAEREALQRTHAEDLQDMQNLLEEKEKQLKEKQSLLDQKVTELENMPDALRAEHEQELEATKAALMDELKANMEEQRHVQESLQEESNAALALAKEELAAKHLEELRAKDEKIAIREANLLAEKELLEKQIKKSDESHQADLQRLQEQLRISELELAKRRKQIADNIAKQMEIARKAKRQRRNSIGAVGKFLRLQSKTATWSKLKEDANQRRIFEKAKEDVTNAVKNEHIKHIEAYSDGIEDNTQDNELLFFGADEQGDQAMLPDAYDEDLEANRNKHIANKEKNKKTRVKMKQKIIAVKNALKGFLKEQNEIDEQIMAVEEKRDSTQDEAEKKELTKLHDTLVDKHDVLTASTNASKQELNALGKDVIKLETEFRENFSRPIQRLRAAVHVGHGAIQAVAAVAVLRRKVLRKREEEKLSKIRELQFEEQAKRVELNELREASKRINEDLANDDLAPDKREILDEKQTNLIDETQNREQELNEVSLSKKKEMKELEGIEQAREAKEQIAINRLRAIVKKNSQPIKYIAEIARERDKYQDRLSEIKDELQAQQDQVEREREEIMDKYEIALKNQDVAQQTELSELKKELEEKEKLLEQKDEMLQLEMQLDHSDRLFFQKEKASKVKIQFLEEQLHKILEEEDAINEEYSKIQTDRVRIARVIIPSSRKKMEIENDNRLRVSRQKKKEIMNQKMRVENGIEKEIAMLKQMQKRENAVLEDEIKDLEKRLDEGHKQLEHLRRNIDVAFDDEEAASIEIDLQVQSQDNHKLEMQIVKLRDRLLQRQDTDRAETALRHSALHAREILNEIEKLQNKIDSLEILIEKAMTTIEVETNEMKKCQGDDVEHYKIHIGHLQEEREAYIQEAEKYRSKRDDLLLQALQLSQTAMQKVTDDTKEHYINKQKDELLTLLSHVDEKETILEQDEEILRIDRLHAVRNRLALEPYDQAAAKLDIRKQKLQEERKMLEEEIETLYNKLEIAKEAKLAREQAEMEQKVSKDVIENTMQKQARRIKELEIDHLKLDDDEKKLQNMITQTKEMEKTLVLLSPNDRIVKEQRVAQNKVDIQIKQADIKSRKTELDARASSIIKNTEAIGAGQLIRQKQEILTSFLRSLDSERFNLELKEEALREKQDSMLTGDSPAAEEDIESALTEVKKEKSKLNELVTQIITVMEEEREAEQQVRLAAVEEMERQQLDSLQAKIGERMKSIQNEMAKDMEHEFLKRDLVISESVTSLLSNVSSTLNGQKDLDDLSDEAFNIVSETQDEKRNLRATHGQQMSELHALAEETKRNLMHKLEKMRRQRKTLGNEVKRAQKSDEPGHDTLLLDLQKKTDKIDAEIRQSSVESHRIDLDLRESEREKREHLREDEMASNEKLKLGLKKLEDTLLKTSRSLEVQRNEAKMAKAEIENAIRRELKNAVSSLKKTYAKKIGEEEEDLREQEKDLKSKISHLNDSIIVAKDSEALELKKKQTILSGKLELLASKQIELSKLGMNAEKAINDQASRHEASIREKYQKQLVEVEQKIKNAEDRLEREKQKIDRSHDAALREESLLIKSRKIDFEESEKDKEALAAVERMEAPGVTSTELSSLNRKIAEVHESTTSLREQREGLGSTEDAQVESEEDVLLESAGDQALPPDALELDLFESGGVAGDEALPDENGDGQPLPSQMTESDSTLSLGNIPSDEQMKAYEEASQEVVKIGKQKEQNDEAIKKLQDKIEKLESDHAQKLATMMEDQEREIAKTVKDSKLKEIKLKIKDHIVMKAKLAKQYEEFKKMKDELHHEKQKIAALKLQSAIFKSRASKEKPEKSQDPNDNALESSHTSKENQMEKSQEKKLSIEKAKSIRVEAEAIEKAKEKLDISLGNIEKDRENLEKDREAAVQAIEIVIEEKKAQEKLIQDKKASKRSLKSLLLKHMGHLKAVEAFDIKLQELKAKEEKAKADHAAEVLQAQQRKRRHLGNLLNKHKKNLGRIRALRKQREENDLLKKKIEDERRKEQQKVANSKKNRFSKLMKKHKQELSLVTKSAKKDMQIAAMKEGMKSAREKREMDRATAAELRRQLDLEKERYRKRSWIRIPDRTEVMAATVIQSWLRGCNVRHNMGEYRRNKAIVDAKRNGAAKLIQKNWRGVLGRQKALFRQKLADMGMVYQWKADNKSKSINPTEDIDGIGVNTEPALFTKSDANTESMKTLMLAAQVDTKSHRLNAPDSLMSTARSMRSDLSQDSIEEIKLNEKRRVQSVKSGDLYRHTAGTNKARQRAGVYIDDKDSLMPGAQALTPYSNSRAYPQKRDDLINQAIGILVGNEQY